MPTSNIYLDTGSTLATATHTISEDAITKHIPRSVLNNSSGTEIGTTANPIAVTGSTIVTNTVNVTGSSTVINTVSVTGNTTILSIPAITGSVSVINTITVTGTTTGLIPVDFGRTFVSASGTLAATNGTLVISAASTKIKVYAFSITTTSSTQQICKFQTAVGGTDLWHAALMTPAGGSAGANLAVSPPAYLFATPTASILNLNLSSANAVHWSVSYFMEA